MVESVSTHHQQSVQLRIDELDQVSYPATMGKYDTQIQSIQCMQSRLKDFSPGAELEFHADGSQFKSVGLTLPRRGKITKKNCGQELGYYQCPTCEPAKIEKWVRNCSKAECPVCGSKWLKRRTSDSGDRLEQISKLLRRDPKHVVFSPPRGWNGKGLTRILRKAGLVGGLKVSHPWRFQDKITGEPISWKQCDLNPDSEFNIPSVAILSPHVHVMGFGFLMAADKFFESTGWVYKNLGTRRKKSLYGTLGYILSHVGIGQRKQTVTWFGICANNQMRYSVIERYEGKHCPICDSEMLKFQFYHGDSVRVEPTQKVRYKFYRFR